jgi:starch synthase
LIADPKLCAKFGQAGRKRAEAKFSWAAIAAQTKALYERLLAPRRA